MPCRPTCKECTHIFPTACAADLKEYVQAQLAKEREEKRIADARALEMEGRKHCYDSYFSQFEEEDGASSSSSSRRLKSSRGLKDSSSGDDRNNRKKDNEADELQEQIEKLQRIGRLECPPAQCLTSDVPLLYSYFKEKLFWHHNTREGQCLQGPAGDCSSENRTEASSDWCRSRARTCTGCGLTWCPPPGSNPIWGPITAQSFKPPSEVELDSTNPSTGMMSIIDFDRDACGQKTVTGIPLEEAEGLEWLDPAKRSDSNAMANEAESLDQDFDAAEAEEFESWIDQYTGPTLQSVFLVFQITEPETEVNTAALLTAVASLSGRSTVLSTCAHHGFVYHHKAMQRALIPL